jgi:hypothetical protein
MGFHFIGRSVGVTALLIVALEFGPHFATASAQAVAQASSEQGLVGFWYGEIENLTGDVRRVLAIKEDGTCYWSTSYAAKKLVFEKDKCTLDHRGGSVELVTGSKSRVPLTLVDKDHLKGLFLDYYHGGHTPHALQMRRIQNPEARAAISAAIR